MNKAVQNIICWGLAVIVAWALIGGVYNWLGSPSRQHKVHTVCVTPNDCTTTVE